MESFLSSDKDLTSMFDFSELANPAGWEDAVMKKESGPRRSERPRSAWKMSTNADVIDEGSMDYLGIYSEDVFLSRATRVRQGMHNFIVLFSSFLRAPCR